MLHCVLNQLKTRSFCPLKSPATKFHPPLSFSVESSGRFTLCILLCCISQAGVPQFIVRWEALTVARRILVHHSSCFLQLLWTGHREQDSLRTYILSLFGVYCDFGKGGAAEMKARAPRGEQERDGQSLMHYSLTALLLRTAKQKQAVSRDPNSFTP